MSVVCYSIHNLLDITLDENVASDVIRSIDFSIGHFKTDKHCLRADSCLNIKPYDDFHFGDESGMQRYRISSENVVTGFNRKFINDSFKQIAIEKHDRSFTIYVSRSNFNFTMFIQLLLVNKGVSLLAAAAISDADGRVTLFPGAGRAGKSSLAITVAKNKFFRLLGDDTVCLSEQGECLSFPRSFSIKDYQATTYAELLRKGRVASSEFSTGKNGRVTGEMIHKLLVNFRNNAPFLGLLNTLLAHLNYHKLRRKVIPSFPKSYQTRRLASVPLREVVGDGAIMERGGIEQILYLERHNGNEFKLIDAGFRSACRRMFATLHREWHSSMWILFAMGMMDLIDLTNYFDRVRNIIESGLSGKKISILVIPENATPAELEEYFLENVVKK